MTKPFKTNINKKVKYKTSKSSLKIFYPMKHFENPATCNYETSTPINTNTPNSLNTKYLHNFLHLFIKTIQESISNKNKSENISKLITLL